MNDNNNNNNNINLDEIYTHLVDITNKLSTLQYHHQNITQVMEQRNILKDIFYNGNNNNNNNNTMKINIY
eukprot:UN09869